VFLKGTRKNAKKIDVKFGKMRKEGLAIVAHAQWSTGFRQSSGMSIKHSFQEAAWEWRQATFF